MTLDYFGERKKSGPIGISDLESNWTTFEELEQYVPRKDLHTMSSQLLEICGKYTVIDGNIQHVRVRLRAQD